jgi:hypothetical protein
MTKLFLCLLLAAFTASLCVEFQWERDARREWRQFAQAVSGDSRSSILDPR